MCVNGRPALLVVWALVAAVTAGCVHRTHVAATPSTVAASPTSTTSTTASVATTGPAVTTTTRPKPIPVLGRSGVYQDSVGFGQMKPRSIFLGGEAESAVVQITWTSWGAAQATGQGTGCYYSGTQLASECTHEQVTLFAFDRGMCERTFMYQKLEYVFKTEGETFDPTHAMNVCTGQ